MLINSIRIKDFRNIESLNIIPDKKINFLTGNNAQGKTNFIESIYYCSYFKSYRTKNILDLIKNGKESSFINIETCNSGTNNNIKVFIDKNKTKKISLNSKVPKNREFYKIINTILYYPDEINYLSIYPQFRRNFIDRAIFITDFDYVDLFNKYRKCLKQRNILLKNCPYDKDQIDIWKNKLIEFGSIIIKKRMGLIERINEKLKYFSIQQGESYFLKYNDYNYGKIEEDLLERFERNFSKELKYGYTIIGPHSDDIIFKINDNDIRKYASEGQKKTFLLNLKLSQIVDYRSIYNDFPIVILDDISNELDNNRKDKIIDKFFDNSGQIFITTTLPVKNLYSNNGIFLFENGSVIN